MREVKLAAAQVASRRGDISHNVKVHLAAIAAAAEANVSLLLFPELSLIGYEPDLAQACVLQAHDSRLTPLAEAARQHALQVIVGASIESGHTKPYLGAFLFQADGSVTVYAKMHLGSSESQFFTLGTKPLMIDVAGHKMGMSICADSAQPSHPAHCAENGASLYAASVFLNEEWYATDAVRFPMYARQHQLLVLMANHAASVGTLSSVGKSAVWGPDGRCLAAATGTEDALIMAEFRNAEWRGEVRALMFKS